MRKTVGLAERGYPASQSSGKVPDPTFRRLLGEPAWRRLAPSIRERFRWKPAAGAEIRYVGAMTEVRCSTAGWLLAQFCRLLGTPLAPHRGRDIPVTVALRLAGDGEGVRWERAYAFPQRAPVRCISIKKVGVGEGLMECVAGGIGMWLKLSEREGALHFRSTGYFWEGSRFRLALPAWLTPGELHVLHADEGNGCFRFCITIRHGLLGELFHQDGLFHAEGR